MFMSVMVLHHNKRSQLLYRALIIQPVCNVSSIHLTLSRPAGTHQCHCLIVEYLVIGENREEGEVGQKIGSDHNGHSN